MALINKNKSRGKKNRLDKIKNKKQGTQAPVVKMILPEKKATPVGVSRFALQEAYEVQIKQRYTPGSIEVNPKFYNQRAFDLGGDQMMFNLASLKGK